jgi:hypothetical protein
MIAAREFSLIKLPRFFEDIGVQLYGHPFEGRITAGDGLPPERATGGNRDALPQTGKVD